MEFTKLIPSDALKPYINCYWMIACDYKKPVADISFPDGRAEIVFGFGLTVFSEDKNGNFVKQPVTQIIGQTTKPYFITVQGKGVVFGIRFFPHSFSFFYPAHIAELNDDVLPSDLLFGHTFSDFAQECLSNKTVDKLIEGIEKILLGKVKRICSGTGEQITISAINYILDNRENTDIDKLVKNCGTTNRTLQKLFLAKVGYSPKFLIRVIRFQKALNYLQKNSTMSLTSISLEAGYFDQSHFIRDFKEFTGLTPSKFSMEGHPINKFFFDESSNSFLYK